jgi:lauroyl/myristoyl acyltransferase
VRRPADARSPDRTRATWTTHVLNTGTVFALTCAGVARLPRAVSYRLGWLGATLAHVALRRTSAALAANFAQAFPNLTARECRTLARATYRSYAADVVDFLLAAEASPAEKRQMFEILPADAEMLGRLMAEGRGVLLACGHHGNWEIGSVLMHALGHPLTVVAMAEASPEIDARRRALRERLGVDTLEVRHSIDTPLRIRRRLAENRFVALLMDRHIGRDRVAVQFFGRRAWFLRTPALLAYLSSAPLLPVSIVRRGAGRFVTRVGQPIVLDRAMDREAAVQAGAQSFAAQLEAMIREAPQCWYQFYPYWAAQEQVDGERASDEHVTRPDHGCPSATSS